jgi:hypothetical protein
MEKNQGNGDFSTSFSNTEYGLIKTSWTMWNVSAVSLMINGARYTHEVKSRIATPNLALKKKVVITSTLDLNLKKKLKCYIWGIALYGAGEWGTLVGLIV